MIKKTIYGIITVTTAFAAGWLLRRDIFPFLQWWVTILCLGIIFMPLTSYLFRFFHDKGYLFSKTIGVAVAGYLTWLFTTLRIMKFTEGTSILVVLLCLLLNVVFLVLTRDKFRLSQVINRESVGCFFKEELLFFGLFMLFLYIRGFKPEAYGTEKFMDYGFMTSMFRSEYMPPQDLWYSGHPLNYYYVGQFIATFLSKLSFVGVAKGYNLMLMMLGAFGFVLPYSLVCNLIKHFSFDQEKKLWVPNFAGLTAGAAVCIAGNMHYPTYRFLEPFVRKFFGMEKGSYSYWFPDATRFIGYHPETNDKTIHEFPSYSFVLGDLHAHVINIFFVLTVLGILVAWLLMKDKEKDKTYRVYQEIFHPAIVLLGFFIGIFHMTNRWDYPIYYVVSGSIILFSNMLVYNCKSKAFWLTALQGVFVMLVAKLIALPFDLNFDKISSNIKKTVNYTPINQLIILWGLPIFIVIAFVCFLGASYRRKQKNIDSKEKNVNAFLNLLKQIHGSDLFIVLIGFCAIGLILLPEVIYIEDIYSGDYKRANTMFKLTYQAYILFGICIGYILGRLLFFSETKRQKKVAVVGLLLFLSTLLYPINAVNAWFGNVFKIENYQGIDASAFMEEKMPDDYLATKWLLDNIKGMPIVLEANGDSYTDYQRVSVITGLPTVLGWRTHEWLWRSDTIKLDQRAEDIELIYTSEDSKEVQSMIERYGIAYVYVGKLEENKYGAINHELIKSLGDIVFISPKTQDKLYETYIVQVRK